jgi:hypothetical protein
MTRATLVSLVMLGPTAPSLDSLPRLFEEGPFLSEEQKRDIFCNNAARFLRLSEEEIARHHGG